MASTSSFLFFSLIHNFLLFGFSCWVCLKRYSKSNRLTYKVYWLSLIHHINNWINQMKWIIHVFNSVTNLWWTENCKLFLLGAWNQAKQHNQLNSLAVELLYNVGLMVSTALAGVCKKCLIQGTRQNVFANLWYVLLLSQKFLLRPQAL